MLFLEVMYADKVNMKFRRVRVPIAQANTLPRTNVLFMILSAETRPANSRRLLNGKNYRRRYQWGQEDNYALLITPSEVACWAWSTGDHDWISLSAPDADTRPMRADAPFLPPGTLLFEGVQIDSAEWGKAVDVFEAEMH